MRPSESSPRGRYVLDRLILHGTAHDVLMAAPGLGDYFRLLGVLPASRESLTGFPFPLAVELLPTHLPLPAKIRTELLDPVSVVDDPERVGDEAYVQAVYEQVRSAIQAGMGRLAKRRRFPVVG